MSILLTPGQAGDNPQLLPLLDQIHVHRDGPGRPRKRPDRVLADKATPAPRPARRCAGAESNSPAPSAATRSPTARPRAPAADAHPSSTPSATPTATSFSAASTGSSSSATWPPATPSARPTSAPRSSSSRSCCGCAPTYRTGPRQDELKLLSRFVGGRGTMAPRRARVPRTRPLRTLIVECLVERTTAHGRAPEARSANRKPRQEAESRPRSRDPPVSGGGSAGSNPAGGTTC